MSRIYPLASFVLGLVPLLLALHPATAASADALDLEAPPTVLIRGVTVLTMEGSDPESAHAEDRDVLLRAGRIEALGPPGSLSADGAQVVDGAGRVLMPGLIDGHVHLRQADHLRLALAHGVTGLRNMQGTADVLRWRDEVAAGLRLGPSILTSSPILHRTADGSSDSFVKATSPQEIQELVTRWKKEGYDLVKVAELDDAPFMALAVSSAEEEIQFAGHLPNEEMAVATVLAAAPALRSVEHLDEVWSIYRDQSIDDEGDLLARFVDLIAASDVAVTPIFAGYAAREALFQEGSAWLTEERVELVRRQSGDDSVERLRSAVRSIEAGEWSRPSVRKARVGEVLRALDEAGVKIVAGTDSGGALRPMGAGLHYELRLYVESGLGPYRALRTATVNAARILGWDDRGRVAEGLRADLLLLGCDPSLDLVCLEQIEAMWIAGRPVDLGDLAEERAVRAVY